VFLVLKPAGIALRFFFINACFTGADQTLQLIMSLKSDCQQVLVKGKCFFKFNNYPELPEQQDAEYP